MAQKNVTYKSAKKTKDAGFSGIFESFKAYSWVDKVAWGALLLIVLLVPLITSSMGGSSLPLTYDQFDVPKVALFRALSLIALGAWSWSFFVDGRKLRFTPILYLVLAFLGWVTLSTVFSDFWPVALFGKYRRFEGLISFVNFAFFFFLLLQYLDSMSRVRVFARMASISFFGVALYGVMQSLGFDPVNWGTLSFEANRAFSTYGNPDLLGGILVFGVPLALALALTEKRKSWRVFYWVTFLLNSACLVVSFVRGAWIAGIVALMLMIVILVIQKPNWEKIDWGFISGTGLVAGAFAIYSLTRNDEVMNVARRFASIFDTKSGSGFTRLEIWKSAIEAIKDRPLLGHGPDTFRLLFPKYKTAAYVQGAGYRSVADNVHNYILQLATGIGIIGVALMYGIFIWVAIVSGKWVFTKRLSKDHAILLGGFWAACAAYLVHLFFGLSVVGSTFFLWASLAVLMTPSAKEYEFKPLSWGAVPAGFIILACMVGSFFNIQFVRADHAYLAAKQYSGAAQFTQAIEEANKAVSINPYNDIYRAEAGIQYSTAAAYAQKNNPQQAKELYEASAAEFEDVVAFCPMEYDNYVFLANTYMNLAAICEELGEGAQADAYVQKAEGVALKGIEVEEYGPLIRYVLANVYQMEGRTALALEQVRYAIELDPQFEEGKELLLEIESGQAAQ